MIRVTVETIAGEIREHVVKNTFDVDAKPNFLHVTISKDTVIMYNAKYIRAITIHKIGSEYVG